MRNLFAIILLTMLSLSFIADAQAGRFGGGRSFGISRAASSYSRNFNSASPLRSAVNPATSANKWLGPLAGFALGGLLTSLFMGHGFGSGILSWLMILGAAYFIWGFVRSKLQPIPAATQYNQYDNITPLNNHLYNRPNPLTVVPTTANQFSEEDFLRKAKATFIRLQAAYDNKNLADIREFTTPEVFAEIQLQLHERGTVDNVTEVVTLNAELLGTENIMQETLAGVRFSGMIKEDNNQPAQSFRETWHFKQDVNRATWKVAGLQQE